MIRLSNGHELRYVVASGALAFDGEGWIHERPLVALGLIRPELFTVVLKTVTWNPREGNLRWWKPWECVRPIPGGAVNKVGLTNIGFEKFLSDVVPDLKFGKYNLVASLMGTPEQVCEMISDLNAYPFVAYELNPSCPNTGSGMPTSEAVIANVKRAHSVSNRPLLLKVSVAQDYLTIAEGVKKYAEAIDLNSVPWEMVFPDEATPLATLERRVKGGGGGVSGKPAQQKNWQAVNDLYRQGALPVIGPSIMEYEDLRQLDRLGSGAYSFGCIHLPSYPVWLKPWTVFTNPCKPTRIVRRHMDEHDLFGLS